MSNVAFVASTVPVVLLHRIIANKKINTIVLRRDLVKSYQYLLDSHDNIKLIILKSNVITSTLQILLLLLLLKIKNNKIYLNNKELMPRSKSASDATKKLNKKIKTCIKSGFKKC